MLGTVLLLAVAQGAEAAPVLRPGDVLEVLVEDGDRVVGSPGLPQPGEGIPPVLGKAR